MFNSFIIHLSLSIKKLCAYTLVFYQLSTKYNLCWMHKLSFIFYCTFIHISMLLDTKKIVVLLVNNAKIPTIFNCGTSRLEVSLFSFILAALFIFLKV